jgi:hypothetical protein
LAQPGIGETVSLLVDLSSNFPTGKAAPNEISTENLGSVCWLKAGIVFEKKIYAKRNSLQK